MITPILLLPPNWRIVTPPGREQPYTVWRGRFVERFTATIEAALEYVTAEVARRAEA